MAKIYTKTGDDGTSSLASGERVHKYDLRLEAYGTVDELNTFLGWLRSSLGRHKGDKTLEVIQHKLFNIGSILALGNATYPNYPEIHATDVHFLEESIDELDRDLPPLANFILPSNHETVARAHICRTICRRAERRVVALEIDTEQITNVVHYLNRLSDYFFILSRSLGAFYEHPEIIWKKD